MSMIIWRQIGLRARATPAGAPYFTCGVAQTFFVGQFPSCCAYENQGKRAIFINTSVALNPLRIRPKQSKTSAHTISSFRFFYRSPHSVEEGSNARESGSIPTTLLPFPFFMSSNVLKFLLKPTVFFFN